MIPVLLARVLFFCKIIMLWMRCIGNKAIRGILQSVIQKARSLHQVSLLLLVVVVVVV